MVTDGAGRYRASSLALGHYEVKAEVSEFRTAVRRGIEVTVGAEAVVDLLQLGVTRRMARGFQAQLSYTWSKTIAEGDGVLGRFFDGKAGPAQRPS